MRSAAILAWPRPPMASCLRWVVEPDADLVVDRFLSGRQEAGEEWGEVGAGDFGGVGRLRIAAGDVDHFADEDLSRQLIESQPHLLAGPHAFDVGVFDDEDG